MGMLIASRALQGIGGGGLFSLGQAAIADVVSARERGRYQGYITGIWGLASIAGPLIGGLCTDYLTWRWAFWINLPVGIIAFVMVDWALKRIPGEEGAAADRLSRRRADDAGRHGVDAGLRLGRRFLSVELVD